MRRVLVAAVLVLAGTLSVPSASADHERYLTLSGRSSGYVEVRFNRSVYIDGDYSKYQGSGLVGYYVEPIGVADEDKTTYGYVLPGFGRFVHGSRNLPAGAYRVYLMADRQATVRLYVHGMAHHITPRALRPVRSSASYGPLDVKNETTRWAGHRATEVRGGKRSRVFTQLEYKLPQRPVPLVASNWGETWDCLAPRQAKACEEESTGAPRGVLPKRSETGVVTYGGGPPGTYASPVTLVQNFAGSAQPTLARGSVIEIALV